MQRANGQRDRPLEEIPAPVGERGGELEIARQRLHFVAVARAVDRRDEAVDRAVADERTRGLAEVHYERARKALDRALDDLTPEDVPGLDLLLERVTLNAGRTFDAPRGAERILREAA